MLLKIIDLAAMALTQLQGRARLSSGTQYPVQCAAPVDHPDRRSMISRLVEREMRRIIPLQQFFEECLLVCCCIDRIPAAMREPKRQLGLEERALAEIGIGYAAEDHHSLEGLHAGGVTAQAPTDL